jgi:hypothetical protein
MGVNGVQLPSGREVLRRRCRGFAGTWTSWWPPGAIGHWGHRSCPASKERPIAAAQPPEDGASADLTCGEAKGRPVAPRPTQAGNNVVHPD